MKLVLVHDWLTGMRGGEKCLEPLCRRYPQAPLLTLLHRRGATSAAIERMRIQTSFLQHLPGGTRYYRYLLPLMPAAAARLRVPADAELVLSFSHAVAKGVRVPGGVPHVCYCFTPMRYVWHRQADYFVRPTVDPAGQSAWRTCRNALSARLRAPVFERLRRWDREAARGVSQFVAVSQTVSARIAECYGRESRVVYPPVDTEFYTPDDRPREDYYLCVSALVPYKRIDLAIAACARRGRRLVIVGSGPEQARLRRLARGGATFLGWLPGEEIREHLRRCRALLFPGHEDFGIVPVEAQACGAPVIAFGQGGVLESVVPATRDQAGTAVLFGEQSADSLGAALEWFEKNRQSLDAPLARRQTLRFTAQRYEREMLALLQQVVSAAVAR